jgi:gliding motility-associated-like protein
MIPIYRIHIILLLCVLGLTNVSGQMSMPDNVCLGETKLYNVDYNPGSTYVWWIDGVIQPGFTGNKFLHTWNLENTYLLEVREYSAEGCPGPIRSGQIFVTSCLIIPNAFSPNGDLINDDWTVGNIERYPEVEIRIYDNWGKLLWKSDRGYSQKWDGTSNGDKLPVDSYFYVIDLHNGSKPIGGSVTIIK